MLFHKKVFRILLILPLISNILAQIVDKSTVDKSAVSESINGFAVNLLKTTAELGGDNLNLALSPYTVWTLLTIISEGARGDTLKQIETALMLPKDRNLLRNVNKDMAINLLKSSSGVSLDVSNAIFTTLDYKLNSSFQQIAKKYYNVDVTPTNFTNTKQAVDTINSFVSGATKGRIQNFVSPADLMDALIFLTSTMHFKGEWLTPFNKSATTIEAFYDEKGVKIGSVNMMYQTAAYPYKRIEDLNAIAVELPYGKDDRASMIVLLPYKGETIVNVLKKLGKYSLTQVMKDLTKSAQDFPGEDVNVYFPKFKTNSDLNLNVVLTKMGIQDVFSESKADLLGMFPEYLYVHRVIQKAEIDVNEEGTEASAAAGAELSYKMPSPKFQANKPFIYFIFDKPSGSVIFAGKVSNPIDLQ